MKQIFLVIIILFVGFVLWMNVTTGHFRVYCCSVLYKKDSQMGGVCAQFCLPSSTFDRLLLKISNLDLNK